MHKIVESTKYREVLREQIIVAASQLFRTNGIRSVKMDDIADSVSCSKRTLYELFSDKEELLISVLDYVSEITNKQLKVLYDEGNVMHLILESFRMQLQNFRTTNPLFYVDTPRFSRAAAHMESQRAMHRNNVLEVFRLAVAEGYFRDDIDYELMIDVFLNRSGGIFHGDLYLKYPMTDIFKNTILVYFRGLCTDKGLVELDQFIAENYK